MCFFSKFCRDSYKPYMVKIISSQRDKICHFAQLDVDKLQSTVHIESKPGVRELLGCPLSPQVTSDTDHERTPWRSPKDRHQRQSVVNVCEGSFPPPPFRWNVNINRHLTSFTVLHYFLLSSFSQPSFSTGEKYAIKFLSPLLLVMQGCTPVLVVLCNLRHTSFYCALLHCASRVLRFLRNWRQDPPRPKRSWPILLWYSLYYSGLDLNLQYL